jgi:2-polyprenyl-3-methyl-5-hydroxy-6-metoxy-1,4-benzoquinol methylase
MEQDKVHFSARVPVTSGTHPERFDPEDSAHTLMDSEHRGRYSWAAQLVAGRSTLDAGCGTGYGLEILAQGGAAELTGVDLDPAAVAAARQRGERNGAVVTQADLQALEFSDDCFDVAVCFETIEHLAAPERGLAELRRVVRPGGTLIVSSPNPDVYPSGNEHHLHEFRPEELRELVGSHFPQVHVFLQHAWLASLIEPAEGERLTEPSRSEEEVGVRRSSRPGAGEATFTIVVGCDADEQRPSALINLGDPFEVRWWEERVLEAGERAEAAIAAATDASEGAVREADERASEAVGQAHEEVARVEAKLAEQELGAARSLRELASQGELVSERLQKTAAALVSANQELAEVPVLKHRLAEMYGQTASLQAQLDSLMASRSWRVTGFLRQLFAMLKPQR